MYTILSCLIISLIGFINMNPIELNPNPMLGDKFEGDIAGVTPNTLKGLAQVPNAQYEKWPGGQVPYVISSSYTPQQVAIIQSGMRLIEDQTRVNGRDCIKFVPRSNQATYLSITSQSGCWSYVGKMKSTGAQQVSLQSPSCVYMGIAAHELMHALGFWHEQSRADRDSYVRINWGNIQSNQEYNFDKYTTGVDTLGYGYDYYSLMHYEWNAFSRNGQATIEALTPGVSLRPAWEKTSLSSTDVGEIRKFYGCT